MIKDKFGTLIMHLLKHFQCSVQSTRLFKFVKPEDYDSVDLLHRLTGLPWKVCARRTGEDRPREIAYGCPYYIAKGPYGIGLSNVMNNHLALRDAGDVDGVRHIFFRDRKDAYGALVYRKNMQELLSGSERIDWELVRANLQEDIAETFWADVPVMRFGVSL